MKKIFVFEERSMNGTVTMHTGVACFTSRELADQVHRLAVERLGGQTNDCGMTYMCGDVREVDVYETADEIPLLKTLRR